MSSETTAGNKNSIKINSLSEVDKKMKDFCNPEIESRFKETNMVIDSIYNINEESVNEIFDKIKEYGHNYEFILMVIQKALIIRPKQIKSIIKLLESLNQLVIHENNLINEIIKEGKNSLKQKEEFCKGDIEKAIMEDNVEMLIKISGRPDFNSKNLTTAKNNQSFNYVITNSEHCYIDEYKFTYMQLMAFFGSIKCFKYALMDGSFDDYEIAKFAVAGGNKEIINLLEQKNVSFVKCLETSIKFHRDEISDWIIMNYGFNFVDQDEAIMYQNNRAFFFVLKNKEREEFTIKDFLVSATTNNIDILKYAHEMNLIPYGFHMFIKFGLSVIITCIRENIDLIKCLIEDYHIGFTKENIEFAEKNVGKYLKAKTGLHEACEKCDFMEVKRLIEEEHFYVDQMYNQKTALQIAIEKNNFTIIKYLVENGHANLNIRNREEKTPLEMAREVNNPNVVRFLNMHK